MKVRFYCDLLVPYHLPKGTALNICATTMPFQGKVTEGFKRFCFDVDFPPDAIAEGTPIPASAPLEVPSID